MMESSRKRKVCTEEYFIGRKEITNSKLEKFRREKFCVANDSKFGGNKSFVPQNFRGTNFFSPRDKKVLQSCEFCDEKVCHQL